MDSQVCRREQTRKSFTLTIQFNWYVLVFRPQSLLDGMNRFLRILDISFRRDDESHRPRINKKDSVKDTEQKKSGNFFFLQTD